MVICKPIRTIKVDVDPGVCGFKCAITAVKENSKKVALAISGSECRQIQRLSAQLTHISLQELFLPISRNPVYIAAERSGCHTTCVIPVAVLKAAEIALGMAIGRNVKISIENIETK